MQEHPQCIQLDPVLGKAPAAPTVCPQWQDQGPRSTGHPVLACTQCHQRSVRLCLPLVHIAPEQLGDGTCRSGHPRCGQSPPERAGAPRLGVCPPTTHRTPHGLCPLPPPLLCSKSSSSITAAPMGRPACPAHPDICDWVQAEGDIFLGHSWDMGPRKTTHLKQHPEFVSSSDNQERFIMSPRTFCIDFPGLSC